MLLEHLCTANQRQQLKLYVAASERGFQPDPRQKRETRKANRRKEEEEKKRRQRLEEG